MRDILEVMRAAPLQGAIHRRLATIRVFTDRPEESLRLRVLILAILVWVALSLNWVTGSPIIPLGASILAVAGHWVSWRWRRSPLGYRSLVIVIAIIGLSIATREDFVSALTTDRLPIAEYLLLISAISSFGVRTRGGLYAQLALSGLVLFFVSERAFDTTFVGFLIVFLGLFLTFSAMAFMADQISIARVHWPEGQLGRFWFWLGIVGGGLLVCSALAFTLMPPDYRGHAGSQRVGVMPFMGESASLDTPSQAVLEPPSTDGEQDLTAGLVGQPHDDEEARPGGIGASTSEEFRGPSSTADPRDTVMHVRSPVSSYWRGRLFDRFDGQTWLRSKDRVLDRIRARYDNFYWQAYFLERDQLGSFFVGYNPVRAIVPEEVGQQGHLLDGSIYSVLSQRPELTSATVRADRVGRLDDKYLSLPPSSRRVRELAEDIVGDAQTPFLQLWLIVSYLRQHHSYDITATDQLQLSRSTDEFLIDGTTGTSLDFASATVLLARAAGLPARLAAGYLPGRFDPFSGTHRVRSQDAHAWAEVNFAQNGWVAFDGTPRPELEVFTSGNLRGFGGSAYIFQTRVGGGLYQVLQSGASTATDQIASSLRGRSGLIGAVAGIIAAVGLASAALWVLWSRSRRETRAWQYSRLSGEGRSQVLQTYERVERLLRRKGLQPRERGQSIRDYMDIAAQRLDNARSELEWFMRAAWVAAYDPIGPSPEFAHEALERLSELRRIVRSKA